MTSMALPGSMQQSKEKSLKAKDRREKESFSTRKLDWDVDKKRLHKGLWGFIKRTKETADVSRQNAQRKLQLKRGQEKVGKTILDELLPSVKKK